jgi:hypothetical protein
VHRTSANIGEILEMNESNPEEVIVTYYCTCPSYSLVSFHQEFSVSWHYAWQARIQEFLVVDDMDEEK